MSFIYKSFWAKTCRTASGAHASGPIHRAILYAYEQGHMSQQAHMLVMHNHSFGRWVDHGCVMVAR